MAQKSRSNPLALFSFYGFVMLLSFTVLVNSSVVKLYDNFHFYELSTNHESITGSHESIQLFNNLVVGEEKCVQNRSILHVRNVKDFEKSFNLKAEPIIYSNDEKTLSFLIEISFSVPDSYKSKIKGYEVIFEAEDPQNNNQVDRKDSKTTRSCIQIIPRPNQKQSRQYRLRIKDPSFVSIFKKGYSFYFGRIQVQALIECRFIDSEWSFSTSHLCVADNAKSHVVEVGILELKTVNTSNLRIDQCRSDIMSQTCIKRYKDSESTFIIMHPMPLWFDRVLAAMDPISRAERAIYNRDTLVEQNVFDYDLDFEATIFDEPIESFHYQKYPNDLVFKLVSYTDDILYSSILKDPNSLNNCIKSSSGFCQKKNELNECPSVNSTTAIECTRCYSIRNETNHVPFRYIPFGNRDENRMKVNSRCDAYPVYAKYGFDAVGLETRFQNQALNKKRKLPAVKGEQLYVNRDLSPRFCIDFQYGKQQVNNFNIKLIFNDAHKVAQSSMFANSTFDFNLYVFQYRELPKLLSIKEEDKLFKIGTRLLTSNTSLQLSDSLELLNLKQGNYLIELIPRMNNKPSGSPAQCVDESNRNNQIHLVNCNKVIGRFTLKNQVYFDLTKIKEEDSLTKPLKPSKLMVNKLEDHESVHSDHFICSDDNQAFQDILQFSIKFKNYQSLSEGQSSVDVLRNNMTSSFFAFDSGLLPGDFELNDLYMPYFEIPPDLPYKNENHALVITLSVLIVVVLLIAVMLIVVNFAFIIYKSNYDFIKQKRRIVIFLSIFVSSETQKEYKTLLEEYVDVIKKSFKNISFDIISYQTDMFEREHLLRTADLILYVFATRQELEFLEKNLIIAQSTFHIDYDRIHRVDKYRKKTINMTFNKLIQTKVLKKSSRANGKLNHIDDSQTVSLVGKASSKIEYFVLPNESMGFLEALVDVDEFKKPRSKSRQFSKIKHYINIFSANSFLRRVENTLARKFSSNFLYPFSRILELNEPVNYIQPIQRERLIFT